MLSNMTRIVHFNRTPLSTRMKSAVVTTASGLIFLISGADSLAFPMTLDQAQGIALANNKDLQVKRLAVRTAETELLKARLWSPYNPELEVEAVSDVLTANSGERTLQLGLTQEIELGRQRKHRIEVANAHVELASLEVTAAEQALKRDVRASFFSVNLSQQQLLYAQSVDSLATALRDTAAVRVKGGFLPASEFISLDLDLAATRTALNKAAVALGEDKNRLMRLLGSPRDGTAEAVGQITVQPLVIAEDSLLVLAAANRPELQANKLHQSAAHAELNLVSSERTPNLKVSALYSQQHSVFSANNFIGNTTGIRGLKDVDHLFGIRFSLPLPLIDKLRSEIAHVRSEIAVNNAARQDLDEQTRYEVHNAFAVLRSTESTLELLQQTQPEADSLFQLLQSAYAQGRVLISDYLTQKERLLNLRFNLLDAYRAYLISQTEFERVTGLDWDQLQQRGRK